MKIIREPSIAAFFRESAESLVGKNIETSYMHTLFPSDGKPVVVHNHTFQLTFVIEGSATFVSDGKAFPVAKNDMILINAGESHQFIAKEPLKLFHLHVPHETEMSDRIILTEDDYELH